MRWPGCPPMRRLSVPGPGAGLGLTTSEDGGLDEVEESLRALASCSRSSTISACKASTCVCNRRQPAHGVEVAVSMPAILWPRPLHGSAPSHKYRLACTRNTLLYTSV